MPIRFRCQFCNQLLGIARRKAGTQVECPTCHNHVQVPTTEPAQPAPVTAPQRPLFEQSDFDNFLQPAREPAAPAPAPAPLQPPDHRVPSYDVDRLDPAALAPPRQQPAGVFLSPSQATLLTVAAVFLLAIAFGAGLLIGRYCL
jgi:phage FluMu protein Com